MLQKTMDKSPLFCGFAVVHKKGSGRIIRDGGAGGNITIMFDSTACLLYTSPSPRDVEESRMPSSA